MFKKPLILLLLIIVAGSSSAQTAIIDSLRKKLYRASTGEQKLQAYLLLFEEYQSLNRDSMDTYAPEIMALADKSVNPRYKSLATLAYANWYLRWGWIDSALHFIEPEIKKNPVSNPSRRDIYFKLMRAKAMSYGSKSRLEEALEVLYKMLPEAERYNDTLNTGLACNTIGSIAIARHEYKEALRWIDKALDLSNNQQRFLQVVAPAYLNKGNAYNQLGKKDSAIYFIDKALPLCRRLQNLNYVATGLRLQSNIYTSQGNYEKAEKALLEMIDVRTMTSPASQVVEDNMQLAEFYANSGKIEKAIEICLQNLRQGDLVSDTAKANVSLNNDPKLRLEILELLAGYYKKAGKNKEYQASLEALLATKDSFYAANSADAIADLQTKYEVQKKENTILQQRYGLQRKNFLFYGSLILLAVLLLLGVALFLNYKKKQKERVTRLMEEEKRQAETAIKEAGEKERVRIASDLHDNLGAYAASMSSNLSYINTAPFDEATQNAFRELSNNSGAIISQLNDTIWVLKKESLNLTAISDRIKIFIHRISKSYPAINTDVKEEIEEDCKLSSSQAFHLYRMLQEAINNALKHSKGKNVTVRFGSNSNGCKISVEDDGVGMQEISRGNRNGHGVTGIRERAKEAGWEVNWEKRDEGGTIVAITIIQ